MATKKRKQRTKKSRKSNKIQLSESWLSGSCINSDLAIPVARARSMFENWEENEVRMFWDALYHTFCIWKYDSVSNPVPPLKVTADDLTRINEAEPWERPDCGVNDPLQLLLFLERIKFTEINDLINDLGRTKILAVIILHESSVGDGMPGLGSHITLANLFSLANPVITAIKTERELSINLLLEHIESCEDVIKIYASNTKLKKEILDAGRSFGALKNKEKAEIRAKGLRDAAIYHFSRNPVWTYNDCVQFFKSDPSLKKFIIYKKDSTYSDRRLIEIISGTKNLALQNLEK